MKLLSTNAKLEKQNGKHFLVAGLAMAPHTLSGTDVCPGATPACKAACVLWFTGRTVMEPVRDAMIRRARFAFDNPEQFRSQLIDEVAKHESRAAKFNLLPAIRPNIASDLDYSWLAELFPEISFYDYTKVRQRLSDRTWPSNYQLTYSVNEKSHHSTIRAQLDRGGNVAAVFSTRYHPQSGRIDPLPALWRFGGRSFRVVDGDVHDVRLRDIDGSGVIVGLRFKGSLRRRAIAIKKGFCFDVDN